MSKPKKRTENVGKEGIEAERGTPVRAVGHPPQRRLLRTEGSDETEPMRPIDEKNLLHPWLGVPRITTWPRKDKGAQNQPKGKWKGRR